MVKKTNELQTNLDNDSSPGPFQKFLILVLIPLLFVLAIVLLYSLFTGVNVFDKAKELTGKLPFIGEESGESPTEELTFDEQFIHLQAEIQEKEAEVYQLQQKLDDSTSEKNVLLQKQEQLLQEIEALKQANENSSRKFSEIVLTFEQMSAKSAAPVLEKMSNAEAIRILTNLKPETLAAILEKLPADKAAEYTSMMTR